MAESNEATPSPQRSSSKGRVAVGSHRPKPELGLDSPPPQLSSRSRSTTALPHHALASSPMPAPASSPGAASRRPLWADDSTARHCTLCRSKFTFFLRKHHCRSCGNIFCGACTERKRALPKYGYIGPQRICDSCYDEQGTVTARGSARRETRAGARTGDARASQRRRTPTEATTPLRSRAGTSRLLSGDAEPPTMHRGKAIARNNSHEDQWLRLVQESDSTVEKLKEFLTSSKEEGYLVDVSAVAEEAMHCRGAVHYASMNRGPHALEILQYLFRELGLSLCCVASDGMTVLHCACAYGGSVELVDWIVKEYPKEIARKKELVKELSRESKGSETVDSEEANAKKRETSSTTEDENGQESPKEKEQNDNSKETGTGGEPKEQEEVVQQPRNEEDTAEEKETQGRQSVGLAINASNGGKRAETGRKRRKTKDEPSRWEVPVADLATAVDANGNSALHHACSNTSSSASQIVAYLLTEAGMSPAAKSLQGFNALHKLCRTKRVNAELLQVLLDRWPAYELSEKGEEIRKSLASKADAVVEPEQKGLNRRFHPDQGLNALMLVARHSLNVEAARCLLSRGASVNKQTRGGESAATLAAASRVGTAAQIIAFMQVLQEYGMNLTLRNKKNESAAMQAILKSDHVLTRWLVTQLRRHILKRQQESEGSASADGEQDEEFQSQEAAGAAEAAGLALATPTIVMDALITACSRPNLPVLLALVDGAPRLLTGLPPINLNQPVENSPEGNTALGELCGAIREEKELDCIIWLLSCGADPKKTNRAGQNAAHRLVQRFKDHALLARYSKHLLLLLVLFWANHQVDLWKAKTSDGDSVMDLVGTRNPRLSKLAQCRDREHAMELYGEKLAAYISSRKVAIAREVASHEAWVLEALADRETVVTDTDMTDVDVSSSSDSLPSLAPCTGPPPAYAAPPPPQVSAPSGDASDVSEGAGERESDAEAVGDSSAAGVAS